MRSRSSIFMRSFPGGAHLEAPQRDVLIDHRPNRHPAQDDLGNCPRHVLSDNDYSLRVLCVLRGGNRLGTIGERSGLIACADAFLKRAGPTSPTCNAAMNESPSSTLAGQAHRLPDRSFPTA